MSLAIFLLWLVSFAFLAQSDQNIASPKGFFLSCGDTKEQTVGSLRYVPDNNFTSVGNSTTLNGSNLVPILSTVRFFPVYARKYCYKFDVIRGGKYLVRTTYFYGGFDGGTMPPIFDQIIGGTKWSVVDTTEDFGNGLSSFYEIIVAATGDKLSVCLARNHNTSSHPFISALEVVNLDDSVYNSTDFTKYALSTVARSSFGDDDNIGFPEDEFTRMWQPFKDLNPVVHSKFKMTPADFWNKPPAKAFLSSITTSQGNPLQIHWPSVLLPNSRYYIALYFQDNRNPGPNIWRVFNVSVNGRTFYNDLNVTTNGVSVYGTEWPLSGQTNITLTPGNDMPPLITAGEIFQILPLAGETFHGDVMAMEELARMFINPPSDWIGEPCLPPENSWTGVTCSRDLPARVLAIDLVKLGLVGTLPESIGNLTALQHLWLIGNKLTGPIPEMASLTELESLHLEDNHFEGWIPPTLGQLPKLREIFLQNNNLVGPIPDDLQKKSGLIIQLSPGNHLSQSTHAREQ